MSHQDSQAGDAEKLFRKAMMALRLEVDGSIVDSVTEICEAYANRLAAKELQVIYDYPTKRYSTDVFEMRSFIIKRIATLTKEKKV